MERGKIFIISGPSGVGKGTIMDEVLKDKSLGLHRGINITTRKPRKGDEKNPHYIFIDKKTFLRMYHQGLILEKDKHFGVYYGTSKIVLEKIVRQGKNALIEIDALNGSKVAKELPKATSIFIYCDRNELKKRLEDRRDDPKRVIEEKMERSKKELQMKSKYDYNVLNPEGKPEEAVTKVKEIIGKEINN